MADREGGAWARPPCELLHPQDTTHTLHFSLSCALTFDSSKCRAKNTMKMNIIITNYEDLFIFSLILDPFLVIKVKKMSEPTA